MTFYDWANLCGWTFRYRLRKGTLGQFELVASHALWPRELVIR